jgi:hypothetical protein
VSPLRDTRCTSTCEVIDKHVKRCIRPHEHLEESHIWIEALNRSDGAPRMVIWTNTTPPTKIMAYIIDPDAVDEVDRNARAYGWEVGNGHPLVEQINTLSEDNPFMNAYWKNNMVESSE